MQAASNNYHQYLKNKAQEEAEMTESDSKESNQRDKDRSKDSSARNSGTSSEKSNSLPKDGRRNRPSRLPPPVPPPPELFNQRFYDPSYMQSLHNEQLRKSMMMSPDVNSGSAAMHKQHIENHLHSLMDFY